MSVIRKALVNIFKILTYSFAAYGLVLALVPLFMKLGWTDERGVVDPNSAYYQGLASRLNVGESNDLSTRNAMRRDLWIRIDVLNEFFPQNASKILDYYLTFHDDAVTLRMVEAAERYLNAGTAYREECARHREMMPVCRRGPDTVNAIEWMNIPEWSGFKQAVLRDRSSIDSAAALAGVNSRAIVACIIGEQIRKVNSRRERFKDIVAPIKALSISTQFSYGIAGIKDHTAKIIERNLRDSTSKYYLGKHYENLLDYDTATSYRNRLNDTLDVRLQRLTQTRDHFYAYLYTGLFLAQVMQQWRLAGYPIDDRPEILATIFNLGFVRSIPKQHPDVGGSYFKIGEHEYSFGRIAYEFYFSGDLGREFPLSSSLRDNGNMQSGTKVAPGKASLENNRM